MGFVSEGIVDIILFLRVPKLFVSLKSCILDQKLQDTSVWYSLDQRVSECQLVSFRFAVDVFRAFFFVLNNHQNPASQRFFCQFECPVLQESYV